MARKEKQRSIKQIIKDVAARDVLLRNAWMQAKDSKTKTQTNQKKSQSRPRATNLDTPTGKQPG
jgi:hypothetical protein